VGGVAGEVGGAIWASFLALAATGDLTDLADTTVVVTGHTAAELDT